MKTRIIHTKFWADGYVSSLTPQEKIIFLYYLTNEKVNIIHLYECPDRYVLLDTGVSRGVLEACKEKLQRDGKIRFYKDYVLLVNADKYESYKGKDNETAKDKLMQELSQDVLDWYINIKDTPLTEVSDDTDSTLYSTISHKSEIINNKKGVVKGISLEVGLATDEHLFAEIAEMYQVPVPFVASKWDDLRNYCESTGKRYRNYQATLKNWVKKDALEIRKGEHGKSKITVIS